MTHYDVEMDDLGNKKEPVTAPADELPAPKQVPLHDSTEHVWALSVAGMFVVFQNNLFGPPLTICLSLIMLCVPLLFFPRFLLFLSSAPSSAVLTPLEGFLCNQLGILMLGMATGVIVAVRIPLRTYRQSWLTPDRVRIFQTALVAIPIHS